MNDLYSISTISISFVLGIIAILFTIIYAFHFFPLPFRYRKVVREYSKKTAFISIFFGFLAGMSVRLMYYINSDFYQIMSFSFIMLTPVVVGAVSVFTHSSFKDVTYRQSLLLPWVPASFCLITCLVLAIEGIICTILFAPLFLAGASIGGLLAKLSSNIIHGKKHIYSVVFLVIPIFAPFYEAGLQPKQILTAVINEIIVSASPVDIWREVKEVAPIHESEIDFSITHLIGFPKPIEAKLVGEGIGAVRHASFTGDLVFTEQVTEWQEYQKIAFDIDVNAEEIPPTTLDEHVTIGGKYFDVLNGKYELEQIAENRTRVRLTSNFRINTHFNWYANLWAKKIMGDIQSNILKIVKVRAEN